MVIDTQLEGRRWHLVLTPKPKGGMSKPSQRWRLEREEKGFTIWNVGNGECFDLVSGNGNPGSIILTYPQDRKKEITNNLVFRFTEIRHEIVIEPSSNDFALTPLDNMVKGVTTTYVAQNKKETPASATQLWKLVVPDR